MKQQPILSKAEWVSRCCERLQSLEPSMSSERVQRLATAMWDRGECQVMSPTEAADFVFDDRVHSGFREDDLG